MKCIPCRKFLRAGRRLLRILFSRAPYREKLYDLYRLCGIRYVPVTMRGNRIWLDLSDRTLARHFFIHRDYEPFEVFLLERAARKGMTALDIGACIGFHTLIISRCVGESGRVIAFEPAPGNYSVLMRNIRANGFENVSPLNAAVMDYRGSIDLYLSKTNFGDHRVYDAGDEVRFEEGIPRERVQVPAVRVDDVLEELRLTADVIKIDVQGAEMAAFRGMRHALSHPEVILFCEFWPYGLRKFGASPKEMLDFLASLRLEICEICEEEGCIRHIDKDELIRRFPDLGFTNLMCFHRGSSSEGALSPFISDRAIRRSYAHR